MSEKPKSLGENQETIGNKNTLNARTLAGRVSFDAIDFSLDSDKKYSIAHYVDAYFSILEPLDYPSIFFIPIDEHSPEFQKRRDEVMWRMMEIPGFQEKEIAKAKITTEGFLEIHFQDGEKREFNLISAWGNAHKSTEEQKQAIKASEVERRIQLETREKERQLQEIVAKEAFYNGSVVVEYIAGTVFAGAGTVTIGAIGKSIAKGTLYAVKSMVIIDDDGVKKRVHFQKPYIGTKEDFGNTIHRIIRHAGFEYNPETRKLTSPVKHMIKTLGDDLKNLTYTQYKQTPEGSDMSEKDFNLFKEKALKKQQKTLALLEEGKITPNQAMGGIGKIIKGNILFFPLFSAEFHKNQSVANFIGAIGNEATFAVGAKLGSKVGSIGGGIGKVAGLFIGGAGAVVGGQHLAEALEANRHKWLHFQKSNYRDERSFVMHATSFGITEAISGANHLWRKFTGNKNAGGIDIGIDQTHVMLPGFNKHLFTIPEVTLFQDKLTMRTKPWEWIWSAAHRDIDSWNNQVDRYKIQVTRDINELLGHYTRNESIFADTATIEKSGGKEEVLKNQLATLLAGGDTGNVFDTEMINIISGIMTEVTKKSTPNFPNSIINEIIARGIGAMKIDSNLYMQDRTIATEISRMNIIGFISTIPHLTEKEKKYIESIPERMRNNRELFDNNDEKSMYEGILKNETIMQKGGIDMKIGVAFAQWLDDVVDWKNEQHFLDSITKGNTKGYSWTF